MVLRNLTVRQAILALILVVVALCVTALLFSIRGSMGGTAADSDVESTGHESPIRVRVAEAEQKTLSPKTDVLGIVQPVPDRISNLTAATPGTVEKLVAPEGIRVSINDLIVQLDERPAKLALNRAEAAYSRLNAKPRPEEIEQARLLIEKCAAAYEVAASRLKKAEELHTRDPELVPAIELEDERRNEQTAKAEWETAKSQAKLLEQPPRPEDLREAEIEVDAAKLQLQLCQVRAPIAGEIVEYKAFIGQRVDVGTPLATILDTSEVFVQARVPGDQLSAIQTQILSQEKSPLATVRCPSFPDEEFVATEGRLAEQTEAQTSDVPIKLRVANPRGLLRVGMTVRVTLNEAPMDVIAIPESAVAVNEEGQHVVTVIRDGKAVPTEVSLSSKKDPEIRADGWIRVLSGLKAGDQVAVENGYALPEGTSVRIMPPRPADRSAAAP
jgi:RND family efflux transporter MFP subunit